MEWILLACLAALMVLGVPIGYGIILACIIYLALVDLSPMVVVPQQITLGLDSFPLLAVPLFILMGFILERARLTNYLVDWLNVIIGRLPGGMGAVAIVGCAMLAALTGSGPATVVAIGLIMIPALVDRAGYDKQTAAGLVAVAGALGPILPPSIIMILYGATIGVSITDIFIGGIIPGLMLFSALLLWNLWKSRSFTAPDVQQVARNETGDSLGKMTLRVIPIGLIPVTVVGGIYGGYVTPTEAAAVGVVASLVLALSYRRLTLALFRETIFSTVRTSALVCTLLAAAGILSWVLAKTKLPTRVAEVLAPALGNEYVYLIALLGILFVVGTVMESAASVVILAPILAPIGMELGVDPVHLAVVFCMALVVGYVTPPFGINLFTAVSVGKIPYGQVVKGSLQPLIVMVIVCILVALIPQTATFLPSLLNG
ncbi:MAG TPA: TRAP transporter large permease subunit [Candidatus Corynebacterium gallistercoris]|uniref:TRAP transporter large permease subunit n=1 Tax=Candidatus Corynebacterium gallistercoris TaxID=2838530 RepID=A0A9D1UQZ7_9CORY|nr:TRAP transporter large permease subunit [Candidatus Corynebacterium gallistercoris]